MAVARRGFLSIDCADPEALASFWAAMLGGEIVAATEETVDVRTDWMWISAMKVPGYVAPTWPEQGAPKQMHLDLATEDLEQSVAMERHQGRGPTRTGSMVRAARSGRSPLLPYDTDPERSPVAAVQRHKSIHVARFLRCGSPQRASGSGGVDESLSSLHCEKP